MRFIPPLLLVAWSAGAGTFFVDPATGNDANNGTAQGTPWAHLPGTVSGGPSVTLNGGDTVYVKGGSINNVQVLISNTHYNGASAYNSIQIMTGASNNWGSGRFIIDGQNTRLYGVAFGDAANGVRLNGAEIRNIAAGDNAFSGNGSACIEMGANVAMSFARVDQCYMHDSPRATVTTPDQGFGIEWTSGASPGSSVANSILVENNYIGSTNGQSIGTKGLEVYGTNNILRNNFIAGTMDHGIVLSCIHCDCYNNVVYMVPPWVHQPMFGLKVNYHFNDIWNNVVYTYPQTTNWVSANLFNSLSCYGILDNASSNRFVFNTGINAADRSGNQRVAGFSWADENAPDTNNLVAFNIFAFTTNTINGFQQVQYFIGTTCPSSYCTNNDFWSGATAPQNVINYNIGAGNVQTTEAGAIAASPLAGVTFASLVEADPIFNGGALPSGLDVFFRPNTPYFTLAPNSPSSVTTTIGQRPTSWPASGAQPSTKFALDITGLPRQNWSMGAYEWTSFPPPPYAVNAIISGRVVITGRVLIQ